MEMKNKRRRHICRVLRVLSLLVCSVCLAIAAWICGALLWVLLQSTPIMFVVLCASAILGLGSFRLADWLRGL